MGIHVVPWNPAIPIPSTISIWAWEAAQNYLHTPPPRPALDGLGPTTQLLLLLRQGCDGMMGCNDAASIIVTWQCIRSDAQCRLGWFAHTLPVTTVINFAKTWTCFQNIPWMCVYTVSNCNLTLQIELSCSSSSRIISLIVRLNRFCDLFKIQPIS